MRLFDSQQYLEALGPPEFVAPNGKKYVGRILSTDQFLKYQALFRGASESGLAQRRAMFKITAAIFPKPWWKVRERSVASWLRTLPPVGQVRAVWDFMQSQAKAYQTTLTPSPGMQRLLGSNDTAAAIPVSPSAG